MKEIRLPRGRPLSRDLGERVRVDLHFDDPVTMVCSTELVAPMAVVPSIETEQPIQGHVLDKWESLPSPVE